MEGRHSGRVPVTSGVPQGSVLGPCLFLHYINDLPEGIRSTVRLFADDTIMYKPIDSPSDAESLQDDLNKLAEWESIWQMEFHPGKCQILTVTNKKKPIKFDYTLHGHPLEKVSESKYLGITFRKDLNWNSHVSNTASKAHKTLGFLRRNLQVSSKSVKERSYFIYVRPILEYCSTVWDPYRANQIHQLDMVQRQAARFVHSRYRRRSSVTNMLGNLNWQSLQDRRLHTRLTLFYKMQNNLICTHPSQYLVPRTNTETPMYYVPHSRIDAHSFSFFPRTARVWNRLPAESLTAPTLEAFKASVSK